jgi:hypothetical protein
MGRWRVARPVQSGQRLIATDLATWTGHDTILDVADVSRAHTNARAPAAAYADGKYYFSLCAAGSIGVATTESPLGLLPIPASR